VSAPRVSVVIPVYNEQEVLPALFARLYPALDALGRSYELVLVDDGSRDASPRLLREQFERRPDVTRVLLLAGNFGQHMAIMSAFEHSRGLHVVTLDADLQNPPEDIALLLAKMDEGHDYVGSIRRQRSDSWWRHVASRAMNVLRERITHLIAVSTLLALITGDGRRVNREWMPQLTMVMTGAEVCDPKVINLWKKNLPEARVINAYGPTEATIVCLTHTIEAIDEAREAAYPIGRPLQGVEARIVDAGRVVTLPGEAGELWIGGSQVMSGYLDAPAETARRIVEQAGVRYYRTGDICRYTETGEIEFVGRRDDEVKLAGRRIHLGELRQLALSHPAVGRAAAGLVDVSGRKRIALIVISEEENAPGEELLDFLGTKLPAYMRPQVLASAHSPCVSSTGKTDERQLLELLQQACARYGADRYAYSADGQFLPAA